jgi:hypothetical protein
MIEIKKKHGVDEKQNYGFASQEVNNSQNLLQIEEKRTMSVEEMFTEKVSVLVSLILNQLSTINLIGI